VGRFLDVGFENIITYYDRGYLRLQKYYDPKRYNDIPNTIDWIDAKSANYRSCQVRKAKIGVGSIWERHCIFAATFAVTCQVAVPQQRSCAIYESFEWFISLRMRISDSSRRMEAELPLGVYEKMIVVGTPLSKQSKGLISMMSGRYKADGTAFFGGERGGVAGSNEARKAESEGKMGC
jgi:hypothetical protein